MGKCVCGDCGNTADSETAEDLGWDWWSYRGRLCPDCLDMLTRCVECRRWMTRRESLKHVHVTQPGKF